MIDKPAGLVVHPAPGHERGTVVNALLAHDPQMQINGSLRPGVVHRIDKDTSGLLIAAKHERALAALTAQFQARQTLKVYLALLDGDVDRTRGRSTCRSGAIRVIASGWLRRARVARR
ncbi:MAG: RNA pseudouridine synthase [Thermomicrobiales bacterium]